MASCAETAEPVLATSNIPIQTATESFARSQATMVVECIRVLHCDEAGARCLREDIHIEIDAKAKACQHRSVHSSHDFTGRAPIVVKPLKGKSLIPYPPTQAKRRL
jgi:hypothetical protein